MLSALHIKNYVLIDSLDVSFPEGLVIITGQTGAGKSILLGALSLILGAKADAAVIMEGADSCVVEAEFQMDAQDDFIDTLLEENDIETDGGHLIIRRVVNASGRSRSFINDCPVQVAVLGALSTHLVDIHSQHQSLLLTDRVFQLSILDRYAGNTPLLERCKGLYKELQATRSRLATLTSKLDKLASERDYTQTLYEQLEAAALRPGELEELEAEQKQLANAEQIKENLAGVRALCEPEEQGLSVAASLKEASRLLSRIKDYVPAAEQLSQRLDSSRIELEDILEEVSDVYSGVDVSPERLESVEERLSALYSLMRKHSCHSVEELIEVRDSLSGALFDSEALEMEVQSLEKEIARLGAEYDAVSDSLHAKREGACAGFSKVIENSIRYLELENAVFQARVLPSALSATGKDGIAFTFSASGRNPVELAKCASGGEISRIMLCLKALMAKYVGMPTMIFDEIDTGVSGSVADKMGSMICEMGRDMQVFAITHLPQVAAKGKAHYLVSKGSGPDAVSTISLLDNEGRINELARMLSGSSITRAAIENAKSLLFE